MEMGRLTEDVEEISDALAKGIEGLDAEPDVAVRGAGLFVSRILVGAAIKLGCEPQEIVEKFCDALKESTAAAYADYLSKRAAAN